MKQEMIGWQWYQTNHMQIICISLQTDNHASTWPLSFCRPDAFLQPNQQHQSMYMMKFHDELSKTRSHPEMVGDMSHVTLNLNLSKIPFVHFWPGSRPILTPKIKHAHLLVLIWERLQMPTTTTMTPTTPDATVQPLGWHTVSHLSS